MIKYFDDRIVLPSPLLELELSEVGSTVWIKRDELIHPLISGNKWRKLQGFVNEFLHLKEPKILASLGGMHSNHLHALAYVAFKLGKACELFVYGHSGKIPSPVLEDAKRWGAKINMVNRVEAEVLREGSELPSDEYFWIPEGGASPLAASGIVEMLNEMPKDFDQEENLIAVAIGSGSTAKYIYEHTKKIKLATFSPVKSNFVSKENARIIPLEEKNKIAFGAYDFDLVQWMGNFQKSTGVLLDPIYTGRLVKALSDHLIKVDLYKKVFILHSGGLQGWRAYSDRYPQSRKLVELTALEKLLREITIG